jgi:hypothetical protein
MGVLGESPFGRDRLEPVETDRVQKDGRKRASCLEESHRTFLKLDVA